MFAASCSIHSLSWRRRKATAAFVMSEAEASTTAYGESGGGLYGGRLSFWKARPHSATHISGATASAVLADQAPMLSPLLAAHQAWHSIAAAVLQEKACNRSRSDNTGDAATVTSWLVISTCFQYWSCTNMHVNNTRHWSWSVLNTQAALARRGQ